ncbi:MAG: porin family protein [Prevotella sp.]|nr:PorT family protein [Bacteroidales bacterium]MDY3842584.1 porin family protein [Prevotella sp.]
MKKYLTLIVLFLTLPIAVSAQIGEHRNDLTIGVTGGYVMSNVRFTPKVPQGYHGGMTGGLAFRYVCEKYFKTIASVYAELNYSQLGWKEDILDRDNQPVINGETGLAEAYSRTINYIQVPVMAHLAWGREYKGLSFFLNLGPQFGIYMSESTKSNFDFDKRNTTDRASLVVAQDTMAVENKFDYGIAVGLGAEYSIPKAGHILLEGRYYYGLGNLYGDTKRDFFGSSNFGNIVIKLTYLFDITKTKK